MTLSQYLSLNFVRTRDCFEKCGRDEVEGGVKAFREWGLFESEEELIDHLDKNLTAIYRKCGCLMEKKSREYVPPKPSCRNLEYYLFPTRPSWGRCGPGHRWDTYVVCKWCHDHWINMGHSLEFDVPGGAPRQVIASCLPADEVIPADLRPVVQFDCMFPYDRRSHARNPKFTLQWSFYIPGHGFDEEKALRCHECEGPIWKDVADCPHCEPTIEIDFNDAFIEEPEVDYQDFIDPDLDEQDRILWEKEERVEEKFCQCYKKQCEFFKPVPVVTKQCLSHVSDSEVRQLLDDYFDNPHDLDEIPTYDDIDPSDQDLYMQYNGYH